MFHLYDKLCSTAILIIFTVFLIYYQEVLGYLASFILKALLHRKIIRHLNKDVKVEDEQEDLVILSTSVQLQRCHLKAINLSPFVGVENGADSGEVMKSQYQRRTFLLGLSMRNFEFVCQYRIKVQNRRKESSLDDEILVDGTINISFEAVRLHLFSLGILLLGHEQIKNMIYRIPFFGKSGARDANVETNGIEQVPSNESDFSNISSASEATPPHTPLYILNKIIGGGEIVGFRASTSSSFHEEKVGNIKKESCFFKLSLRSKRMEVKLQTLKESGRADVLLNIENLKTRLRSGFGTTRGDGDGEILENRSSYMYDHHIIQIKSVKAALELQSSFASIDDKSNSLTSTLMSCNVRAMDGVESNCGAINVTTSCFQLISLGKVANEWIYPLVSVLQTIQSQQKDGTRNHRIKKRRNKPKRNGRFVMNKICVQLGVSVKLNDGRILEDACPSDPIQLTTRIMFDFGSAPANHVRISLSDTSLTQIIGSARGGGSHQILLLDNVNISSESDEYINEDESDLDVVKFSVTKVDLGNIVLHVQKEEDTKDIASLAISSRQAISMLLPPKSQGRNAKSLDSKSPKRSELSITCLLCEVNLRALSGNSSGTDRGEAKPIVIFAKTTDFAMTIFSNTDEEKRTVVESGATEASLTFVPHATLPTFTQCAAELYPVQVHTSEVAEEKKLFVKIVATLSKYDMSITRSALKPITTTAVKRQETVIELSNVSVKEYLGSSSTDVKFQMNELVKTDGRLRISTKNERMNNVEFQRIDVQTLCSNMSLLWSPVLTWHIVSGIKSFKDMCGFHLQQKIGRDKNSKSVDDIKVSRTVEMQSKGCIINARFSLGGDSIVDIVAVGLTLSLTKNETNSWDKPDILFRTARTRLNINDNDFDVAVFESIHYFNGIRRASTEEIVDYSSKKGGSQDLKDEVVTGHCGTPLVEMVEINARRCVKIDLPPTVDLGKVIEDINTTLRAMDIGLEKSKLVKPKKRRKRKYQLMDIYLDIPVLDVHFLEAEKPKTCARQRFGKPKQHSIFLDRWRFLIKGFTVQIKRHTPPDVTQSQIRILDEDKSRRYIYGPMIQGGDFQIRFDRVINTLHPLNLPLPLGDIKNWKIDGLLYLTSLSPDMKDFIDGREFCIPVKCHHKNSSSVLPLLMDCNCDYAVPLSSRDIPVKIYYDLNLTSDSVQSTFGDIVQTSISGLMNIIQRLIPKPPLLDSRIPLQKNRSPPLQWWDNLRYQWHGEFKWKMQKMSFRWLLDTIPRYDRSILLTSEDLILSLSARTAALQMNNVIISIPDSSYHMLKAPPINNGYLVLQNYLENNKSGFQRRRHPLVLFPKFKTEFKFQWAVKWAVSDYQRNHSSRHHNVYMTDALVTLPSTNDKFEYFRSNGWDIEWKFELHENSNYGNWLALRGDVLPWITHKSPRPQMPSSEGSDDALPKVNGIQVNVDVSTLNIGAWFDEKIDNQGSDDNMETSLEGIFLQIPKLHYSRSKKRGTSIDLYGPIQAALLEIKKDYEFHHSYSTTKPNSPLENLLNWDPQHHLRCNYEINNAPSLSFFDSLQASAKKIRSLDYLLKVDQIKILDKALEDICHSPTRRIDYSRKFELEKTEAPWTVLVAGMRLLWTVDIRDSVIAIVKDVLFAINFMQVNSRGTPQLLGVDSGSGDDVSLDSKNDDSECELEMSSEHDKNEDDSDGCAIELISKGTDGVDVVPVTSRPSSPAKPKSHLDHLLSRHNETFTSSPPMLQMLQSISPRKSTLFRTISTHSGGKCAPEAIVPTFDLHLTNPQIQFHSEKTGGSIIVGIRGAYIEGKKFTNLFVKNKAFENDDIRLETLFRRTEFLYTLDQMEIFAVSNSVDVGVGLQWLTFKKDSLTKDMLDRQEALSENKDFSSTFQDQSNRKWIFPKDLEIYDTKAFAIPFLGHSIMDPSTFKTRQEFHRPPIDLTKEELEDVIKQNLIAPLEVDRTNAIDYLEFFVDELSFHLDSYQFSTTLDIVRNTMLEPPKPREERYYQKSAELKEEIPNNDKDGNFSSVSRQEVENNIRDDSLKRVNEKMNEKQFREDLIAQSKKSKDRYTSLTYSMQKLLKEGNMNHKKWREHLRAIASELIVDLEDAKRPSGEPSTRHIEYNLCKAKWKIAGESSVNDAEVNFTDFKGVHDFSADGSVSSKISLENMYVTSDKPGSDAMSFHDPTIIVKTILGEKRSPCQRCGLDFDRGSNEVSSCRFHPGSYKLSSSDKKFRWSCCGSNRANIVGCAARPHTGSEKAVDIQFDAFPRVVEGITLYKFIEANVYPGVTHTTIVQLTRSLTKSFMTYFLGDSDNLVHKETDQIAPGPHTTAGVASETSSEYPGEANTQVVQHVSSDKNSLRESRRYLLFGESDAEQGSKTLSTFSDSHLATAAPKVTKNEEDEKSPNDNEIVFLRNWNIGDINIKLSIAGFHKIIDIYDVNLVISGFQRRYKVGSVQHLAKKFVGHLVKSLLSSSLGILKVKLSGSNKHMKQLDGQPQIENNSLELLGEEDKEDRNGDQSSDEGDDSAKNLLLAPPKTKQKKKRGRFFRRKDKN